MRQVEETLQAAMTDPAAAEAVRSGLLAQPLASTGLESLAEVLAVPPDLLRRHEPGPATDKPSLTVVRDETQAARRGGAAGRRGRASPCARRTRLHAKATKKRAKVQAKVLQLEARVEELRTQLAEAEEQAEAAAEKLSDLDARWRRPRPSSTTPRRRPTRPLKRRRELD